jgi:ABC-type branched-subunit amino acid transport system substrate-binding protein
MWPAANSARRRPLPIPLVALTALAALLVACSAHLASTAPTVRIGLVAPFEGHGREIGYDVIFGARLAVRERNQAGGVAGYRVDLVALDDSGDPELAIRAARSLVVDPLVMGTVGHWITETTVAARPIYAESGLPLLIADGVLTAPAGLPEDFVARYEAVTPFDEEPGVRAAAAYDACNLLFDAIEAAVEHGAKPGRAAVAEALAGLASNGISGPLRTEPVDGLNQRLVRLP